MIFHELRAAVTSERVLKMREKSEKVHLLLWTGKNACEWLFSRLSKEHVSGFWESTRQITWNASMNGRNMNLDQLFFFLKIPESEGFEMVILYGPVYVFVYILLCPWTTVFSTTQVHMQCSSGLTRVFRWTYTWHMTCTMRIKCEWLSGRRIHINKDLFTHEISDLVWSSL